MTDIANKIIVITKTDRHVELFEEKIRQNGGILLKLPTTKVIAKSETEIDNFLSKLTSRNYYQYCIFLSPKAVDILIEFARKLDRFKLLFDYLNSIKIIGVGPKTVATLGDYGIRVEIIPDNFSSEGIFQIFSKLKKSGAEVKDNIIIPRSERGDDYLQKNLSKIGYNVDEFFLYTVVTGEVNTTWNEFSSYLNNGMIHSVIFTSPSSVQSFFELSQKLGVEFHLYANTIKKVISIGPLTSKALNRHKVFSILEPKQHSLDGIFSLLISDN